MIVKEHKLRFTKRQTHQTIQYGSCFHIGNPNVHNDGMQVFMDRAKTRPWWHVGDMIESILPGDPRFSITEHKDATLTNIQSAVELLAQANKTCLGLAMGNHEWKASGKLGDITEDMANRAKIPNLGVTAFIDMIAPDGQCRVFTAHGRGSVGFNSGFPDRDKVNCEIKLRRLLSPFEADLKCIGHFHRTIIAPEVDKAKGIVEDGEFKRRPRRVVPEWCVACPSLFCNYENGSTSASYAEIAMMPPTDLGWIEIDITRDGSVACIREIDETGETVDEVESSYVRWPVTKHPHDLLQNNP